MKNKPEELEQFAFNLKGVLAGRRLGDRGIKKFALARALYHPYESEFKTWWATQVSNLRPLPCEGSALPLS